MATTNWTDLVTRKNTILAQLAAMTSTSIGGKPNSSGQGEHPDHVGYKDGLYRELEQIDKLLAKRPFEIESEVIT